MKRLWITDSGIIHHRKPRMDATEYVEAQQQPDAKIKELERMIKVYDYAFNLCHRYNGNNKSDYFEEAERATARAEKKEQNHE